jgi:high-affinity nickel permease
MISILTAILIEHFQNISIAHSSRHSKIIDSKSVISDAHKNYYGRGLQFGIGFDTGRKVGAYSSAAMTLFEELPVIQSLIIAYSRDVLITEAAVLFWLK